MWYGNSHSVGIKCKFGENKGKQVVSFGGKTCGWSQEALLKLGEKCIEKLHDGKDPEEVKKWAREEVKGE